MVKIKLDNIIWIFISIGMLILFYSCTEKINVELDSSYSRLVVYGEITNIRKSHSVRLTRTADYFDNKQPDGVKRAFVSLSDGTTETILQEADSGYYLTNPQYQGKAGKTYTLRISNVDIDGDGNPEEYEASSYMTPVTNIDSIKLSYLSNIFFSGWQVLLYMLDPPDRNDFYIFKVYKNNVLQTDSLSEYIFRGDEFFNGRYTNGIVSQFLNDNKPNEKIHEGDVVQLELNGITEDYYNFLTDAQLEMAMKIPLFSGPASNVRTNISNNALGYFTAYSVSRSSSIKIRMH